MSGEPSPMQHFPPLPPYRPSSSATPAPLQYDVKTDPMALPLPGSMPMMPLSMPSMSLPAEASTSSAAPSPTKAKNGYTGPAEGKSKPHLCTACNRGFTTGGHLQRHQRIHTGVKAFKCPFPGCETRTSRQDNLQQHYRTHLSPTLRRGSGSEAKAAVNAAMAAAGLRSHTGRSARKSKTGHPGPPPMPVPAPGYGYMFDPHFNGYMPPMGMPMSNASSRVPSPNAPQFFPQYNYPYPMQPFRPMPYGVPAPYFPGMDHPQAMYLPPNFNPSFPMYMPDQMRDRRMSPTASASASASVSASTRSRRTPPPPQPHEQLAARGVDPNMMHYRIGQPNPSQQNHNAFHTPTSVSSMHAGNTSVTSVSAASGLAHRHSASVSSDDSAEIVKRTTSSAMLNEMVDS